MAYMTEQEKLWKEFHETEGSGSLLYETNSLTYFMKYMRFLEDKLVDLLERSDNKDCAVTQDKPASLKSDKSDFAQS